VRLCEISKEGDNTMEITTGIHQINSVRGANCYLITGKSKMLLVDTGMPGNGKKITDYVRGLGKKPVDIEYVILTHADIDHVGSAREIKQLTGARLAIHKEDAQVLRGQKAFKTIKGPLGILVRPLYLFMRYHPVETDVILKNNAELNGFKVIHTPGHTAGSICLYLPGKVVFAGDALSSDSRGNPRPLRKRRMLFADPARAESSLLMISRLEFDILLPGHGAPVIGNASARLKNMIESK
jgi:hydroxyacylglutathione hydrolase